MAVGVIARIAARASVSAGRYAIGLARSRGGRVLGGVMLAERVTRPVRIGFGGSKAYGYLTRSGSRDSLDQSPQRRRGASFEYIYKY